MELWWFYDFLMSAESDCIYDGLRRSLDDTGLKVLWDSIKDEPEPEPGDDEPDSGERSSNLIYADQATTDINRQHKGPCHEHGPYLRELF